MEFTRVQADGGLLRAHRIQVIMLGSLGLKTETI